MATMTSAGLFGNLGANHGKLNTRRGKSFLWRDATRRMEGQNFKMQQQRASKTYLTSLRAQLKTEATLVRQKNLLLLVNSALLATLILMAIA